MAEWVEAGERILAYDNPRMRVFGNFFGELDNDGFGRYCLNSNLFPKHIYTYNVVPRITPQGDVFADQLWVDDSWKLGNLRDMTLEECFQTPKFFEPLDSFRHRVDHIPICQECEWVRLCEAGSPGHTYAEFGHVNERDLFCESRIYWLERFVEHRIAAVFGTPNRPILPKPSDRLANETVAAPRPATVRISLSVKPQQESVSAGP